MTTYTAIPDGDIDQDSPVTQPLMTLMRDNPIAITEGAADAPRVTPGALSINQAYQAIPTSGSASFSITDLANCELIALMPIGQLLRVSSGSAGIIDFRVALSDDNGTSYASSFTYYSNAATGPGENFSGAMPGLIDLTTGRCLGTDTEGTITLPAGTVNAIRFSIAGAGSPSYTTGGRLGFYLLGMSRA